MLSEWDVVFPIEAHPLIIESQTAIPENMHAKTIQTEEATGTYKNL